MKVRKKNQYFIYLCLSIIITATFLAWKHWLFLHIDYSRLEQLLYQGKWQESDIETSKIMNKIYLQSIDDKTFFGYSRIPGSKFITSHFVKIALGYEEGFSCESLSTIDKLWLKYSKGNFGLSLQAPIAKLIEDSRGDKFSRFITRDEQLKDKLNWDSWRRGSPRDGNLDFYLPAKNPDKARGFLPSYLWALELDNPKPVGLSSVFAILRKFRGCHNSSVHKVN